ncbi:MAG TPA: hypothetical protein VGO62_09280, partial [Myxococcota bacterium]
STSGEGRRLKLRAAQLALQAGDRKKARALIDGMLEQDPNDKDALALLDGLLAKDASPEEHAAVLESRIRTQNDPRERAQTLLTLADVLIKLRKNDEAGARLLQVLEIDAGARVAHEKLEVVWRTQERFEDLALALEKRVRVEDDLKNEDEAAAARVRLARVYEEKLDRSDDAATLYLSAWERASEKGGAPDDEIVRALERMQAKGAAVVSIAEALQPWYAQREQWRKHVEMMALRHAALSATGDDKKRAALAKAMAGILEDKLKSPREAFDAWADAFVDEPSNPEILPELERLAQAANAHARFADVLHKASERLPDGPQKQSMLQKRADLLQGVLGDQVAAIDAHRGILQKDPNALTSIDALIEIYGKRDSWAELKEMLEKRIAVSSAADAPLFCARLGSLLIERFEDKGLARPALEGAFPGLAVRDGKAAPSTLPADVKKRALEHLLDVYRAETADGVADVETVERLAWALAELASSLAGKERSAVRAELGDVLRGLERYREALQAYEAALANDDSQERAVIGIRALLDDKNTPTSERTTSARSLLARYEAADDHPGRAHVLQVMLALEQNPAARRAIVGQLTATLTEQVDLPDDALDILLAHLEVDPEDDPARRQAEALAAALQKYEELFKTYQGLRVSPHEETALLYSERLAELTIQRGDIDGGLEALLFLANLQPQAEDPWRRMAALYERRNDAAGVASCLDKLASMVEGPERLARLLELSDYCFDTLDDDVRGLDLLRACHAMAPLEDPILAKLEGRLRLQHADTPELAGVVQKRAALQTSPAIKAALLLEHGLLQMRMGEL